MVDLKVGDHVLIEWEQRRFDPLSVLNGSVVRFVDEEPPKKTGCGIIYEIQGDQAFVRMGNFRVAHPLADLKLDALVKPGAAMIVPEPVVRTTEAEMVGLLGHQALRSAALTSKMAAAKTVIEDAIAALAAEAEE